MNTLDIAKTHIGSTKLAQIHPLPGRTLYAFWNTFAANYIGRGGRFFHLQKAFKGLVTGNPDVPPFGRGETEGHSVPRWGKNFLRWRVRPVARNLGIPDRLVTFQVMRRTQRTDMQQHWTLKDTQGMLRHCGTRASRRRQIFTFRRSNRVSSPL